MKVFDRSTIERKQACVIGIDDHGELIWEIRNMERWQMELFKVAVNWAGAAYARWCELFHYEQGRDFDEKDSLLPDEAHHKTRQDIHSRIRQYHRSKRYWKRVSGD